MFRTFEDKIKITKEEYDMLNEERSIVRQIKSLLERKDVTIGTIAAVCGVQWERGEHNEYYKD